jgi:hypothetical protein
MYATTLAFDLLLPEEPVALDMSRLYTQLQRLPDQRARRGVRYPLPVLLMVAILAKLAGQSHLRTIAEWATLRAEEFARLFQFPRATMPHPVTWSRVLGTAVDLAALEHLLRESLHPSDPEVPDRAQIALALDGKTLRGTIPLGHTHGVHLVAAYLPAAGVVVTQVEVATKEYELVVAPTLLAHIDLQGVGVTGDAMYTQRPLSTRIVEAGGDYLWVVKDNQAELRQDVEHVFIPEPNELGTGMLPPTSPPPARSKKGRVASKNVC